MVAAGSSRRMFGGGSNHSSFNDVYARLKHAEACPCNVGGTPDLFESNIRIQLQYYWVCRDPRLKSSRYRVLDRTVLLRGVRGRELASESEVVVVVNEQTVEYYVVLFLRNARGTPISATKRLTTARIADTFFSRVPYGRCRREALSTNLTTCHDPPNDAILGPTVSIWSRSRGLVARPVV